MAFHGSFISLCSVCRGDLFDRTSLEVYNLNALHTFALKKKHVMVLPILENLGGLVRPEITHSACTALSNADVHYQGFNFLNIKIKTAPTK